MFWQCYKLQWATFSENKVRKVWETRQGGSWVAGIGECAAPTAGLSNGPMPWWAYSGHLRPRPKCVTQACVMMPCLHEPAGQEGGWDLGTYYSGRLCCQLPVVPLLTSSTHTVILPTFMSKNISPPSILVTFPKISITFPQCRIRVGSRYHQLNDMHTQYTLPFPSCPCWHATHCLYKTRYYIFVRVNTDNWYHW